MQSPKTGMNSGEVCAIDGWAFAYRTYKLTKSAVGVVKQGQQANVICNLYGTWDNEQPAKRDRERPPGVLSR